MNDSVRPVHEASRCPAVAEDRAALHGPTGSRRPTSIAEQNLLGAMMLSKEAISATAPMLRPDDFYKPAHAHVFDAILSLDSAGEPADPVTVADELGRAGVLESIGGRSLLADIVTTAPAVNNAARYAKIIADHALLRRLIGIGGEISEIGYDLPDDVEKAVDHGRVPGLRPRPAPGHRLDGARSRACCPTPSTASRPSSSGATPSPACPPASSTSTASCRACSRPT